MSRADFERGWRCAVAEVVRKLRAERNGIYPADLTGEAAARIAEDVTPNIGAQRSEVGTTILLTLASPVGCGPASTSEAKLFARMRTGGQVSESCGVFRLTARGRAELL